MARLVEAVKCAEVISENSTFLLPIWLMFLQKYQRQTMRIAHAHQKKEVERSECNCMAFTRNIW